MSGVGQPLPSWLSEAPATPQLAGGRRRRRCGFLEKTLAAIAETLRNELFAEELARRPGLLQGIDPRVKLATVLLLIGVAGLLHNPVTLLALNLWLLWLARASRVPIGAFADGETRVRIEADVRGTRLGIVQPTPAPVGERRAALGAARGAPARGRGLAGEARRTGRDRRPRPEHPPGHGRGAPAGRRRLAPGGGNVRRAKIVRKSAGFLSAKDGHD